MTARMKAIVGFGLATWLIAGAVLAHSPAPGVVQKLKDEGTWEKTKAALKAFDDAQDPTMYARSLADHRRLLTRGAAMSDEAIVVRVPVILIEFPDFHHDDKTYAIPGGGTLSSTAVGTRVSFDSLLFSERGIDAISNPTGSMTEFYLENSYGKYRLEGQVFGWYEAPGNYSYYESLGGGINGMGGGSNQLAADAMQIADAMGADFSSFGNGDAIAEGVIIVHAGPGAESGVYGIWSNSSSMPGSNYYDGVYFGRYAMQPEEQYGTLKISNVGVFCHEWGHVLGVPDWYDGSYSSSGLGDWSLMAGGSWNGPEPGMQPAHFDAWSKVQTGFSEMVWLWDTDTTTPFIIDARIPAAEYSPIAYGLKENPTPGGSSPEFWLVENRQRYGFDESLPGAGLLIYHFDAGVPGNSNPPRYRLALEQADGRRQLEAGTSSGDANDPFPGRNVNNREFHIFSSPNSNTNEGNMPSQVGVWNISDSDSIMYADLEVVYTRPYLVLEGDSLTLDDGPGGNDNGLLEQGETIDFYLEVRNLMKMTYNPKVVLSCDNGEIEFLSNDKFLGVTLNPIMTQQNLVAVKFRIPDDFRSSVVTFTATITSYMYQGDWTEKRINTFVFDRTVGRPQIMLVDDDNSNGDEVYYRRAFERLRRPFDRWDKAFGSPTADDLTPYQSVLWMTGPDLAPYITGGTLTAADVTAMKGYLDNGGNLMLASITAAGQLHDLDSAFMAEYLHANLTGSQFKRWFQGTDEFFLSDTSRYTTRNGMLWEESVETLAATNDGLSAFTLTNGTGTVTYGSCGVVYGDSYKTVLLTFPVEYLADDYTNQGYMPKDSLIAHVLDFFYQGGTTGVADNDAAASLPTDFALSQNYPNPFNPSTTISYTISAGEPELTNLTILNVLGQRVATLVNEVQAAGTYRVSWQGTTDNGSSVASGIYFYRVSHGERSLARKMILLK